MTCFEYGIAARGDQFYGREEEIRTVLEHGMMRSMSNGERLGRSTLQITTRSISPDSISARSRLRSVGQSMGPTMNNRR